MACGTMGEVSRSKTRKGKEGERCEPGLVKRKKRKTLPRRDRKPKNSFAVDGSGGKGKKKAK